MKRLLITVLVLLIVGTTGLILLSVFMKSDDTAALITSDWESLSEEERASAFKEYMRTPLPADESRNAIRWMFMNHADEAVALLEEESEFTGRFPKDLSDVALGFIREENFPVGMEVLNVTRKLFPSDPHVLGTIGIIAYLTDRQDEARKFLEWSRTWQSDIPLVDFYLGGLLIQSESTVDRTRGKTLLKSVIQSQSADLQELAGLALLTNRGVPILETEFAEIMTVLKDLNVFRTDNPNVTSIVMRILINRANELMPEESLPLAKLLLEYEESTDEDRLSTAGLAQLRGDLSTSGSLLDTFNLEEMEPGVPFTDRYRRLLATQYILDGDFDSGLDLLRNLVEEMPDSPLLSDNFRVAMTADIPLESLRQLLALYLQLEVTDAQLSISVLDKLIEVDPLRQEEWANYAAEKLLPMEPRPIGSWLIRKGYPGKVIEAMEGEVGDRSSEELVVYIEAGFATEDLELVASAIAAGRDQLEATFYEFMRARLALKQGDTDAAYEYWKASHNSAIISQAFPLLQNLGFLALELDQPVTALQSLYTAFSAGIPFSQMQAGRLLELTLEYGSLPQSIKVAEFLASEFPESPVHKNNLAYFRFLADRDLEQSVEVMRVLVDEYPNIHNYRLTLALGLLKIGRQNEANRLLQSTPIDWNETGNRGQLIYAAVLSANNQRVVADGLIQNIDLESLIPEEKALIEAL